MSVKNRNNEKEISSVSASWSSKGHRSEADVNIRLHRRGRDGPDRLGFAMKSLGFG